MKSKILTLLLCTFTLTIMGQGIITRQKATPKAQPKPKTTRVVQKSKTTHVTQTPKPKQPTEAAGYDVTFSCNVSSATIYINGQNFGTANGERYLKTGNHTVKLIAEGYEPLEESISVSSSSHSFSYTLKKLPVLLSEASGSVNGHDYIDLGLSVKWATMNVGATTPGDVGHYFAWGETKRKLKYDSDSYTGDGGSITPTSGRDAARANWGGTWRMPTKEEFEELFLECKKERKVYVNNVEGTLYIGPNGNSIFFPNTGWKAEAVGLANPDLADYWTSTEGKRFNFDAFEAVPNWNETRETMKDNGLPVRAVTE